MPFKFDLLADYVEVICTTATSPCDNSQIRSEKIRSTWMQRRLIENVCVCKKNTGERLPRAAYANAAPIFEKKYGSI
jgi:hypothetical protein